MAAAAAAEARWPGRREDLFTKDNITVILEICSTIEISCSIFTQLIYEYVQNKILYSITKNELNVV
jgi:hypothetical protein